MSNELLSVDVPATYLPEANITVVGEKPGADEVNWRVCPKCDNGSTDLGCRACNLSTIPAPQGWVGRAGDSLAKMCRQAGIMTYNKSNVVKCIAGGFTSEEFKKYFYETVTVPKEGNRAARKVTRPTVNLGIWHDRLRSEITERRVGCVIAAGNEALFAFTGKTGIENYRGSLLDSTLVPGQKVVPIIHPAALWHGRRWEMYYVTISDLKKAKHESLSPGYNPICYNKTLWPKWDQVTDFVGLAMQPGTRWCLDLETRGGWIACIGLSRGTSPRDISTLVIPIQTTTGPYWSPTDESQIWRLLALLMRRNPLLVGQNLFSFDLDLLLDYGCEPSGVWLDTMSGFALCCPELPKALDFLVSLYGSLPYYKMESKTWKVGFPDEQLFNYNTEDTFSTLEISWAIENDLKAAGLWDLYQKYVIPVHWMALEMQKRTIPVSLPDRDVAKDIIFEALASTATERMEMVRKYESKLNVTKKRTKFNLEYRKTPITKLWVGTSPELPNEEVVNEKKTEVTKQLKEKIRVISPTVDELITAENFNVGSPLHMQALVFKAMGLPARHKKGSQSLTTDEEALMDLIAWYPDRTDELKILMKEKHLKKALDYVEYKLDEQGNLAFQINFPGTESFRFSMASNAKGVGFNAQTPPRWSRFHYKPPTGRVFISRDLSQVEARCVAALACCKSQLERFTDPTWSIHKDLGRKIYGEVPVKDTPRYTAAKSGVHGGNFREGPLKMSRSTGAPLRETKLAVEGYHKAYPEIRQWHSRVRSTIINKGQLVNPFGFRRIFYKACGHLALQGVLDDSEWNEACSAVPQSIPPFIINMAVLRCMEALPWVWFHHQGHDSYLASVPVGMAKEADDFLAKALDITIEFDSITLRIPSEAQIGYTWLEMMPLDDREPTWDEWQAWAQAEEAAGRGRSKQNILLGINGIL